MKGSPIDIGQTLKRLTLMGLGRLADYCRAQDGAFLCLHSVGAYANSEEHFRPRRDLVTSASFLEVLIVGLRRFDFDLVSIEEAIARLKHGSLRPFVAFTLDDGYADNYTTAFPIFLRHQVPFTVFVTTGFIDRAVPIWWVLLDTLIRQRDCVVLSGRVMPARTLAEKNTAYAVIDGLVMRMAPDRLCAFFKKLLDDNPGTRARDEALAMPLTWAELRTMAATGLATVGCHTVTHRPLSRLDQKTCESEILVARDRIAAELGEAPRFFAYPYGGPSDIGSDAPAIVAKAGFEAAFTTNWMLLGRFEPEAAYLLPRIGPESEDLLLTRAHISGLPSALRNIRNWLFARRACRIGAV